MGCGKYYINPVTIDLPGEEESCTTFYWEVLRHGSPYVQYFIEKKGYDNFNFPAVKGLVTRLNNKLLKSKKKKRAK